MVSQWAALPVRLLPCFWTAKHILLSLDNCFSSNRRGTEEMAHELVCQVGDMLPRWQDATQWITASFRKGCGKDGCQALWQLPATVSIASGPQHPKTIMQHPFWCSPGKTKWTGKRKICFFNKNKGISLILTVLETYVDTFCVFLCDHLQVAVESSVQQTLPPKQLTLHKPNTQQQPLIPSPSLSKSTASLFSIVLKLIIFLTTEGRTQTSHPEGFCSFLHFQHNCLPGVIVLLVDANIKYNGFLCLCSSVSRKELVEKLYVLCF